QSVKTVHKSAMPRQAFTGVFDGYTTLEKRFNQIAIGASYHNNDHDAEPLPLREDRIVLRNKICCDQRGKSASQTPFPRLLGRYPFEQFGFAKFRPSKISPRVTCPKNQQGTNDQFITESAIGGKSNQV